MCLALATLVVTACTSDTPVCDDVPSAATLARTPRADRIVETLALRCTDQLVASQARYETLLADLDAITEIRGERPYDHFAGVESTVEIGASRERIAALMAGDNADFACLNERLGAEVFADEDKVVLEFAPAVFAAEPLQALYRRAVGSDGEVFDNGVVGDGSTITFDLSRTPHRYLLSIGSGDCPSGCIHRAFELWLVDSDGARLGASWRDAADAPVDLRPDAFRCR